MSKEGSPDLQARSGSIPATELKALLKDSHPSLLRPLEDAGSGLRSGKPSHQCLVLWLIGVCVLFMLQVLPLWERCSGVQAGGRHCLQGVLCLLPMMVSPLLVVHAGGGLGLMPA